MLFFPQLSTGCLTQYPFQKQVRTRCVLNRPAGGPEVRLYDTNGGRIVWQLSLTGLSGSERAAIETFFQVTEGRLQAFTWLDPSGNLLAWSEEFTAPAWLNGGFLQFTAGRTDPFGGSRAIQMTNTGQAAQQLTQSVAAPGNYAYCFSAWVRSDAPTTVTLLLGTQGATSTKTLAVAGSWLRLSLSAQPGTSAEQVDYGVELPAGASIEIFGAQAEPQPAPGEYIKTTARSGVHSNARFDQDFLLMEALGPESFAVSVRIAAPL
jgi:hypothetical protein